MDSGSKNVQQQRRAAAVTGSSSDRRGISSGSNNVQQQRQNGQRQGQRAATATGSDGSEDNLAALGLAAKVKRKFWLALAHVLAPNGRWQTLPTEK